MLRSMGCWLGCVLTLWCWEYGWYWWTTQPVSSLHQLEDYDSLYQLQSVRIIDQHTAIASMVYTDTRYRLPIPSAEYIENAWKTHTESSPRRLFEYTQSSWWIRWLLYAFFAWSTFILLVNVTTVRLQWTAEDSNFLKDALQQHTQDLPNAQIETELTQPFDNVIGQDHAVDTMRELVDVLTRRAQYTAAGARLPKGILLVGPPGTGKTLLARCMASECGCPFLQVCASSFHHMLVGAGSQRVKEVFRRAKTAAARHGACVLFIDEFDAIANRRGVSYQSEGDNTLNQLLTELDGFDTLHNVLTLAATNRPELLDRAITRPGRFDRRITLESPTHKDRLELFTHYLAPLENASDLAEQCVPYLPEGTGAMIAQVCNDARLKAVYETSDRHAKYATVTINHLRQAIDEALMGRKIRDQLCDAARQVVAYHEAGHAVIAFLEPLQPNPIRITIQPREHGALGFSQQEAESHIKLRTRAQLQAELRVLMAGRVCEDVFCNDATVGASDDMKKATTIARAYVRSFGLSREGAPLFLQTDDPHVKWGASLHEEMDKDTTRLLRKAYEDVQEMVHANKEKIESLAKRLLETGEIGATELVECCR